MAYSNGGGFSLLAPTPGETLHATDGITLSWTAAADAPFSKFSVFVADAEGSEDWNVYIRSGIALAEGSATLDASYFTTLEPAQIHTVGIWAFTPSTTRMTGISTMVTLDDYIMAPVTGMVLVGALGAVDAAMPTPSETGGPGAGGGGGTSTTPTITSGGGGGLAADTLVPGEDSGPGDTGTGMTTGAKAGIGVGVGVGILVIVGALVFFFSSFSVQRKRKAGDSGGGPTGGNAAEAMNPTQELEGKRNEIAEAQAGERMDSWLELEAKRTEIVEAPNTPRYVHELGA
ncbi:hypothetical protein BJX66DRAFT_317230 [Aspergillus keveii]|uniref:Fibronectin type-III domain-containing protein n=1 Tax=Aspergillus keveii TaxID=714993 RepID=A0ABR4FLH3_9EURO